MNLKILHEDNHIIAVDKEAGILSQQDITGVPSLLDHTREFIREKYNKPGNVFLGLVHRLDRDVSGVIIFAKTSKAAKRLHAEFLSRRVNKMYVALVPVNHALEKEKWTHLEQNILKIKGGSRITEKETTLTKKAKLEYIEIASDEKYSLLCINLLTGRKHQIRAQLSSIGMPIAGDEKYGSSEKYKNNSICLHSFYLKLKHPTKEEQVEIISEIPELFTVKFPTTKKNTTKFN